jgi:DNA (cytosine-5)-methyltransferase 1
MAVTIKRECAHTGNGRYAHPEQDRLCTVREMSILQGLCRHAVRQKWWLRDLVIRP